MLYDFFAKKTISWILHKKRQHETQMQPSKMGNSHRGKQAAEGKGSVLNEL
jgi:hypothetical protein